MKRLLLALLLVPGLAFGGFWKSQQATGTGSVTSVTCGTGLSGGVITTSGTCALAAPTASTLGGLESLTCPSHQFFNVLSTSGILSCTQPAASDVSGLAASATTDTTNASNISSGTLGSARGGAGAVNGLMKADGAGNVSAAVAGADYLTPSGNGSGLTSLTAANLSGQVGIANGGTGQSTALAGFNALLPTYTWATIPSAASNSGNVVKDSDVGIGGSLWISDGTYWKPLSVVTLCRSHVASSVTGTANETQLATCAVPANAMGNNGELRIWTFWTFTNSANNKTARIKFSGSGGTAYLSTVNTTNASGQTVTRIFNVNAQNSQKAYQGFSFNSFGVNTNAATTSSVDTSTATTVYISGQLANSGETETLEEYRVELWP